MYMQNLKMKVAPGAFQVEYDLLAPQISCKERFTSQDLEDDKKILLEAQASYTSARQRRKLSAPYLLRLQAKQDLEAKPENRWQEREKRDQKEREYCQREMARFLQRAAAAHASVPHETPDQHFEDIRFNATFSDKGRRSLALLQPIRGRGAQTNRQSDEPLSYTESPTTTSPIFHNQHMCRRTLRIVAALLRNLEASPRRLNVGLQVRNQILNPTRSAKFLLSCSL